MIEIFNEIDDRLSTVKRWALLRTIQSQSVAEHCFNVERIAVRIAQQWFDIEDNDHLFHISQYALHHDDLEAITGDIPSPAKRYITVVEGKIDTAIDPWYNRATGEVKAIVKLADLMESYRFLASEILMGNEYIRRHMEQLGTEMFAHIAKHNWKDEILEWCDRWTFDTREEGSKIYE